MFGEELSKEAIEALDLVLSIDKEKIEISSLTQIRLEIEQLYDLSRSKIFNNSMQLNIDGEQVDLCNRVQNAYNLFMSDYEKLID